ncbi:atp3 gamma subunit of the F1 sector of mitochondrial F1F0 ATP synthase [Sorochytrium milnesiophthora]
MLSSLVRPVARATNGPLILAQQSANMATLKEISVRLKSIKNISKITKSMKVVATTKLTRAQKARDAALVYGGASSDLTRFAATTAPPAGASLFVAVSSDRGLCGGVHSAVTKALKRQLGTDADKNAAVVVLGDKVRTQLARAAADNMRMTFNQLGKNAPTFLEAALIADKIISDKELAAREKPVVVFNAFKSAIAYETTFLPIYNYESIVKSPKLASYEIEEDVLHNLSEFMYANAIFMAMAEGHASEVSSRRTAMDNATKNAGDIIDRLTMTYNRTRQAAITNDLVDIITATRVVRSNSAGTKSTTRRSGPALVTVVVDKWGATVRVVHATTTTTTTPTLTAVGDVGIEALPTDTVNATTMTTTTAVNSTSMLYNATVPATEVVPQVATTTSVADTPQSTGALPDQYTGNGTSTAAARSSQASQNAAWQSATIIGAVTGCTIVLLMLAFLVRGRQRRRAAKLEAAHGRRYSSPPLSPRKPQSVVLDVVAATELADDSGAADLVSGSEMPGKDLALAQQQRQAGRKKVAKVTFSDDTAEDSGEQDLSTTPLTPTFAEESTLLAVPQQHQQPWKFTVPSMQHWLQGVDDAEPAAVPKSTSDPLSLADLEDEEKRRSLTVAPPPVTTLARNPTVRSVAETVVTAMSSDTGSPILGRLQWHSEYKLSELATSGGGDGTPTGLAAVDKQEPVVIPKSLSTSTVNTEANRSFCEGMDDEDALHHPQQQRMTYLSGLSSRRSQGSDILGRISMSSNNNNQTTTAAAATTLRDRWERYWRQTNGARSPSLASFQSLQPPPPPPSSSGAEGSGAAHEELSV